MATARWPFSFTSRLIRDNSKSGMSAIPSNWQQKKISIAELRAATHRYNKNFAARADRIFSHWLGQISPLPAAVIRR